MNDWRCRECDVAVSGAAHVRLGKSINRGGNAMCLTCADRMMSKMGTPTLHEFVPAYVRSVVTPRPNRAVKELEARLQAMEAILNDPVRLERHLENITMPNTGVRRAS